MLIDLLEPLFPDGINLSIIATFLLLVVVMVAFFREWGPPDLVAICAMGAILLLGLLPAIGHPEAGQPGLLSVFSNGAPITVACMFVLSEGLERSGVIQLMGRFFTRIAGKSELRVMAVMMTMAALLSAFINNTAVVVVFLPLVLAHARATGLKASRLMIPLSFACILGGTCTLTGTSTNLIADGVAQKHGQAPFGMFEVTKLGLLYAVVGFGYMLTVGRKLLPKRSSLAELLEPDQHRDFLTQFQVESGSPLIGKPLTETLMKEIPNVRVLEVRRRGKTLEDPLEELAIRERDRLLLTVHGASFGDLMETEGIRLPGQRQMNLKELETRELKMVEGIVGPQSRLVGKNLQEAGLRQRYGVQILAIHRQGENLRTGMEDIRLAFGDTLLMEGPEGGIHQLERSQDFIIITEPPKSTPKPHHVWPAIGIVVAFVLGASFGVLSIPALAILAALAMVLIRVLTPQQAYESIQWNIIFLIFGMLALGLAMEQTGAASHLVSGIMSVCDGFAPFVILSIIYLLSSVLTEIISNNAVAALLTPIVIGVADSLGLDARPFIVAMMFGCSASFATPIGYQTNTYVYGAGGYRFTDFPRVGVPLNLILWLVATVLIPLPWFWPLK